MLSTLVNKYFYLLISEVLSNKFITRAIALNVAKAFDKMWHWWLLHTLTTYGVSRRVISYQVGLIRYAHEDPC